MARLMLASSFYMEFAFDNWGCDVEKEKESTQEKNAGMSI